MRGAQLQGGREQVRPPLFANGGLFLEPTRLAAFCLYYTACLFRQGGENPPLIRGETRLEGRGVARAALGERPRDFPTMLHA